MPCLSVGGEAAPGTEQNGESAAAADTPAAAETETPAASEETPAADAAAAPSAEEVKSEAEVKAEPTEEAEKGATDAQQSEKVCHSSVCNSTCTVIMKLGH